MFVRYLRCALLVWLPGLLCAQSAAQDCDAPSLDGGYFVPEKEAYSHETTLTFSCESGRKPAAEGWWATSTCHNGKWSPEPQCIDNKACIPPTLPHAIYTKNSGGWYEEGEKIRITCDEGYELKNWDATTVCVNGTWTSVPICEESISACGEPPQVPHAVVVGRTYQEVFAADSLVQYECEEGYIVEGDQSTKSVFCIAGNWTDGPTCSRAARPGGGQGGSAQGGGGGGGDGHTTGGGSRPGTGHGGSTGGGGTPSTGGAAKPVAVRNCGEFPKVLDGEVVVSTDWFLRYRCNHFYKLEGPETVLCYNDGSWSERPTCRADFCSVNTDHYPGLIPVGVKFIKDGEEIELECKDEWLYKNWSVGRCTDGRLQLTSCCNRWQITIGSCRG